MSSNIETEAYCREDGELYYGTLEWQNGSLIFTYSDFRIGMEVEPMEITKVYSGVATFSNDWRITDQIPLWYR